MSGNPNECRCGHDRSQHYKDVTAAGVEYCNCLAMHCECKVFSDPRKPEQDIARTSKHSSTYGKPHSDASCVCTDCVEWFWKHRYGYP